MSRKYRRNCDYCGKYYESTAKRFCSRGCAYNSTRGLSNEERAFPIPNSPYYQEFWRLKGDWTISSDWHIPFYDNILSDNLVKISKKFGIKKHLIAGDFLDEMKARIALYNMDMIGAKDEDFDETLDIASKVIRRLLETFDEVRLLCGNHDAYVLKLLHNTVKYERFWRMLDIPKEEFDKRFFVTVYPFCELNNKWHITHPKSYSLVPTTIPRKLSAKYQRSVISAHGHHFGMVTDVSGRDICIESGGMFDYKKFGYKWLTDTIHPQWCSGFFILKNNKPYLFSNLTTDWDFWKKVKINEL